MRITIMMTTSRRNTQNVEHRENGHSIASMMEDSESGIVDFFVQFASTLAMFFVIDVPRYFLPRSLRIRTASRVCTAASPRFT